MKFDDTEIMLDVCAKFHAGLFVGGWVHSAAGSLDRLTMTHEDIAFAKSRCGLHHAGVASLGPDKGFDLQVIMQDAVFPQTAVLDFTVGARDLRVPLQDLLHEALQRQTTSLAKDFFDRANGAEIEHVLDIGGRARSAVDRSRHFPGKRVAVLDVLPGDNVTDVGDAHEMSDLFPADHFDAFLSVSVFEHLLMPWKVVLEINKVLKLGGFGLVHTHQTLGMHDMPWDFWRFSDTSWDAIFNQSTGFEIVDRALTYPSYILPLFYRDDKATAEQALGFEGSSVIVRKIGPPSVAWDARLPDIIPTAYPSH